MKRIWIIVGVLSLLGALGPAASAGQDSPHLDVKDRVAQGLKLRVKVLDCVSGGDWEATIVLEIYDANIQHRSYHKVYHPSETGNDRFKIKIKADQHPPGKYFLRAVCVHDFDNGGQGTFFDELETFEVRP